ncbi:hypothetical protein CAEBREN_13675 [Caenorhabditis brenneri]|uniref:Sdz-33 F-box domain-containing protein n=1 Tax=Caenorhabditis brenneri TaxID=135651 RepID=G0NPI1_CAEBE|nr:hypothetical protein CAEBREN_13675 [Caenorhabditis brenneri]
MGVPILKIPLVALEVLLDYFNNIELLQLFLLESRKRVELPEWNFKLYCSMSYDNSYILIHCLRFCIPIYIKTFEDFEKSVGVRKNLVIGESSFPVMIVSNEGVDDFHTFWNGTTHGLITFIDYFKSNLNSPIEELSFAEEDTRAIRTVVNHINSTHTVVKKVRVKSSPPLSEEDFNFVLENVSSIESFFSNLNLSWDFEYYGAIGAKNIFIENGDWFTIQNLLMSTESEVIHVNGSCYSEEELRTFLREWKSGKLPKLKKVKLGIHDKWMNYLDVTRGFDRRIDKCDYSSQNRPVVAIKGQGDFYGIVNPNENRNGWFHMSVYRG